MSTWKIWKKFTFFLEKKSKGFSLLEVILVIAIIAILTAVVIPISQTIFNQSNVNTAALNIESDLNRAYTFARGGRNNSDWGVHIEKNLSGHSVILFPGSSYDVNNKQNETYNILQNIVLGGSLFLNDQTPINIIFTQESGVPTLSSVGTITLTSQQGTIKTIIINSEGLIELTTSQPS